MRFDQHVAEDGVLEPRLHPLDEVAVVDVADDLVGNAGGRLLRRRSTSRRCKGRVPTICGAAIALLAAAPLRNPHGVIQISSCCAQAVFAGVMFCWKLPWTAGPPVTGAANVTPVARDAGCVKSIDRT